jgi:hypothetical protein
MYKTVLCPALLGFRLQNARQSSQHRPVRVRHARANVLTPHQTNRPLRSPSRRRPTTTKHTETIHHMQRCTQHAQHVPTNNFMSACSTPRSRTATSRRTSALHGQALEWCPLMLSSKIARHPTHRVFVCGHTHTHTSPPLVATGQGMGVHEHFTSRGTNRCWQHTDALETTKPKPHPWSRVQNPALLALCPCLCRTLWKQKV